MAKRDTAWDSFAETRLSAEQAAHVYRRLAFAASAADLQFAQNHTAGEVVDRVLRPPSDDPGFAEREREFATLQQAVLRGDPASQLPAWWLYRLLRTTYPAQEKQVLFWHGHFATSALKVPSPRLLLQQNELFRQRVWGPFGELVAEISRDPAMLLYLDSASNKRNRPNENFARELMELFCLGLGNYSEQDIRELARAFTGWELRGEQFQFNRFQHDPGEKFLFGQGGIESGEQAIERVTAHPAAARFLAAKLYRYYVADRPPADPQVLEPLAEVLREQGGQLQPAIRKLATSRLFFGPAALGQKIRSPVELTIGLLRSLATTSSPTALAADLRELGQALFYPPNVKGWDGGRQWINSATLIGRINLVGRLVDEVAAATTSAGGLDRMHNIAGAADAVAWARTRLLAVDLPANRGERLGELVAAAPAGERLATALKTMATLPEFQLG